MVQHLAGITATATNFQAAQLGLRHRFSDRTLGGATRLVRRCSKRSCLSTMGPTAIVPEEMGDIGLEDRDGIKAQAVVLQQLPSALAIIQEHQPARITTVGGRPLSTPEHCP
jgi:hypothetical protein